MAPTPTPPKFEKRDHHFVPQFWLRGFQDSNGALWQLKDCRVAQAPLRGTMSEGWLYTIFDDWWRPSDALEDAFSGFESAAAQTFQRIGTPGVWPIEEGDWLILLTFLGLTTCRHPDTMKRGQALAKNFGWMLADVHNFADKDAFIEAVRITFGPGIPDDLYDYLKNVSAEQLLKEAEDVQGLSPQDPRLPQQESIRATMSIARTIGQMDISVLDASPGHTFILGDRPLPLKEMWLGFTVPLSKSLAIMTRPAAQSGATQHRRTLTPAELNAVNVEQANRCKKVLVGPDRGQLERLKV